MDFVCPDMQHAAVLGKVLLLPFVRVFAGGMFLEFITRQIKFY